MANSSLLNNSFFGPEHCYSSLANTHVHPSTLRLGGVAMPHSEQKNLIIKPPAIKKHPFFMAVRPITGVFIHGYSLIILNFINQLIIFSGRTNSHSNHNTILPLFKKLLLLLLSLLMTNSYSIWNAPYDLEDINKKILYTVFFSPPKHLDPARAYSSDEFLLIENIYEPPLQYHYLKRPYELIPLSAKNIPKERQEQRDGKTYFVYDIFLKENVFYAPHPAFNEQKRQLHAKDFVFQIKRLSDSDNHSPIASIMAKYIVGFKEYQQTLKSTTHSLPEKANLALSGVEVISPLHYQIRLKQSYPQFKYWLAMPFFAPMPYEVIAWHEEKKKQNSSHLGIDWEPIGTGPFMMTENNPNYRMVLQKNPHYREAYFPKFKPEYHQSIPEDTSQYNNQRLPLLEKIIFTLEKESLPYWQKFLQGYYDSSGVASDNFDQAISLSQQGDFSLSDEFENKHIQLRSLITTSIGFWGFNMQSDKVGGYSLQQKKLRQAIAIAINIEEYISIFANSRGIVAQGPLPPGIFGYLSGKEGMNPWVYDWKNNQAQRKSIDEAKQLLEEAGYPNGINQKTGEQLVINYEAVGSAGDSRERLEWIRRQIGKLNIQLNIRLTDYNRFREKIDTGNAELFGWGWNADYPDPENFLFLLYGPNSRVPHKGENSVNYNNPIYNELYQKMLLLPDTSERLEIIQQMISIVREDSPWIWGWHPLAIGLYHQWVDNAIPNAITKNTLKYRAINPKVRKDKIHTWNQPQTLPLTLFGIILLLFLISIIYILKKRQHQSIQA